LSCAFADSGGRIKTWRRSDDDADDDDSDEDDDDEDDDDDDKDDDDEDGSFDIVVVDDAFDGDKDECRK
jgi:hypothetical protein